MQKDGWRLFLFPGRDHVHCQSRPITPLSVRVSQSSTDHHGTGSFDQTFALRAEEQGDRHPGQY